MAWQRAGTVSVWKDTTTVVGEGVDFAASSRVGDSFVGPDGASYEITNVASSTVISILPAYKGPSNSGANYAIMPVQGYDKLLSDAFNALVNQFGAKLAALGTTGNYDILPVEKGGSGSSAGFPPGLGVGQSWQDFTNSRVANTNYTNSTGRAITISVTVTTNASAYLLRVSVGGKVLHGSWQNTGLYSNMVVVVPPGAVYSVTTSAGTISVYDWSELR